MFLGSDVSLRCKADFYNKYLRLSFNVIFYGLKQRFNAIN